ncbi:MAG: hypothetical protein GY788_16620, partial [bacterium]|nr:hypothetical protein [bacterium]
ETKGLSFITDIDESLPDSLLLDETRLRQILLNLVGNAVKFTHTGTIKLAAAVSSPDLNHLSTLIDTNKRKDKQENRRINITFSVQDTGIGVPPEQQESIFEPFKQQTGQSHRKYGGTGLGLSISRRLTEMMKGRISLESQPGQGSTFKIMLENVAVSAAGEVIVLEESFDLESISFEPARILVGDDVESNRTLLQEMLPRVNLEVVTAENGEEALHIAGEYL